MDSTLPRSGGTNDNVDVGDYFRPIWRWKVPIVLLVLVVTGLTYTYYSNQPKVYSSSTSIFVGGSEDGLTGEAGPSERSLANQAQLLQTRPVAREVAKKLGFT